MEAKEGRLSESNVRREIEDTKIIPWFLTVVEGRTKTLLTLLQKRGTILVNQQFVFIRVEFEKVTSHPSIYIINTIKNGVGGKRRIVLRMNIELGVIYIAMEVEAMMTDNVT